MYRIDSFKYNDINIVTGLYSVNRRLLWAIGKENNTDYPIYVTITDGTNLIENLEMCEIKSNVYVIDLAPFIQTMFGSYEPVDIKNNADMVCKKVTISATSVGLESIEKDIYCTTMRGIVKQYYTDGNNVTYNNVELMGANGWTKPTETTNVYQSDWIVNDMSDLLLPEGIYTNLVLDTLGFDKLNNNYNITVYNRSIFLSATTKSVNVQKKLSDNTTAIVGTRSIVRQPYCQDKNILILYLTSYGQYEYFVFDGYTSNITVDKTEPLYNNILRSNCLFSGGDTYGNNISEEITASVLINNDLIASKWNDIITSTQVYVYNPNKGDIVDINSSGPIPIYSVNRNVFEKVQVSGQYNFNPRRGSRQSLTLTKNADYVW